MPGFIFGMFKYPHMHKLLEKQESQVKCQESIFIATQ